MTREEGERSKIMWDVETEQDLFFGGREKDPNKEQGEDNKREPVGKKGGDKGREGARVVTGGARSGGDVTKGDKDECGREERDGSTWWGLDAEEEHTMGVGTRNG